MTRKSEVVLEISFIDECRAAFNIKIVRDFYKSCEALTRKQTVLLRCIEVYMGVAACGRVDNI
jgi:hypothetical protein